MSCGGTGYARRGGWRPAEQRRAAGPAGPMLPESMAMFRPIDSTARPASRRRRSTSRRSACTVGPTGHRRAFLPQMPGAEDVADPPRTIRSEIDPGEAGASGVGEPRSTWSEGDRIDRGRRSERTVTVVGRGVGTATRRRGGGHAEERRLRIGATGDEPRRGGAAMELAGLEPATSWVRSRRSSN